jgi:hypothetical protein
MDDIDLPFSLSLSLTFTGYNQAHLCIVKKYKIEYYDCSTAHDRSLCLYIWYTKTIISKCVYFLLRLLLLFLSNLITRAAASVYSHKTENGDTLHLIFHQLVVYMLISVCLIHKKKKANLKNGKRKSDFVLFLFPMN